MQLQLPHGFKRWPSLDVVHASIVQLAQEWRGQQAFQNHWLSNVRELAIAGYCAACARETMFTVRTTNGESPNWRETLECSGCKLINRWRASAHLAQVLEPLRPAGPIYITEQTTLLYLWLRERVTDLIGSEYVNPLAARGQVLEWHGQSIRHEDITALSMADSSLSMVQTYDVLEHVPDYRASLREFARVLVPGGLLLLTAPFLFESRETVVRATMAADGSVEHLLPAVYHGDPMSADGVLCYQEFGWDLLDELRAAGFTHSEIITCWAPDFGYLGSFQPFVVARR